MAEIPRGAGRIGARYLSLHEDANQWSDPASPNHNNSHFRTYVLVSSSRADVGLTDSGATEAYARTRDLMSESELSLLQERAELAEERGTFAPIFDGFSVINGRVVDWGNYPQGPGVQFPPPPPAEHFDLSSPKTRI